MMIFEKGRKTLSKARVSWSKYGYEKTPIKFTSNFNKDRFELK